MREYRCIKIGRKGEDTEFDLNYLSEKGWRVICSYAHNNEWLILERDIEIKSKGGKK